MDADATPHTDDAAPADDAALTDAESWDYWSSRATA